jgi:integrase
VPLSDLARATIASVPGIDDCDLVFTTDGKTPIAGFSKMKVQLDAAIGELTGQRKGERPKIAPWRIHDLRRTAGTHIARIGFPRLLVSKILGHAEGGVTQIYELYSYDDEKHRALEAWANEVRKAVSDQLSASQTAQFADHDECSEYWAAAPQVS